MCFAKHVRLTHGSPCTVDNAGKGVHAGRPQGKAHDEIHRGRADDALIHERAVGHECCPGEPRPGEPHVREMTADTAPLVIYCSLPAPGNCTLGLVCAV